MEYGNGASVVPEKWFRELESAISDTVAHLLNASGNIDELMKGGLNQMDSLVSMELASQSVWAALVSLEQCSR